jgi:predicted DsbA family dithiol-disulfide isomerase
MSFEDVALACESSGGDVTELINFSFDPRCPWCYQTSRWALRLEALQVVKLNWSVFCLELNRFKGEHENFDPDTSKSAPALRTSVVVREAEGHEACGRFYAAIGRRYFFDLEDLSQRDVIRAALDDADLDASLCDKALGDSSTWDAVLREHERLADEAGVFGVPSLRLGDGRDPAMFGPVIKEVPPDDEAMELLTHVLWLMQSSNFYELKSGRPELPDLPYIKKALAERGARESDRSR